MSLVTMNLSSELNQSCEELRLFGQQELSDNADLGLRYFVLGYNIVLFPISLILTGLIIFLIIKFKHLQQSTFLLALRVAILDHLFVLIVMSAVVVSTIGGQWSLGLHACNMSGGVFLFFYQIRNGLMFVFVCDRFSTVFMPFRYNRYRTKVIWVLCWTVLALATICAVPPMILGCFGFNRGAWACIIVLHKVCSNFHVCQVYAIISVALGQIVGSFVPTVMYIVLFIKAKRVRNQIIPSGTQQDAGQRKRDRKANITFFTLFLGLIVVNNPPLLAYIVINLILASLGVHPPEALLLVSYLLQAMYGLLPVIDSIAILRNHEMRNAIILFKNKLKERVMGTNLN